MHIKVDQDGARDSSFLTNSQVVLDQERQTEYQGTRR